MFFGKQLFDEMLHVETFLLLVDNYLPDPARRSAVFEAYKNIPSIKLKADFCFKYMDSIYRLIDRMKLACFNFSMPHKRTREVSNILNKKLNSPRSNNPGGPPNGKKFSRSRTLKKRASQD